MNWQEIHSDVELQEFLDSFDWHDAFIRESHLLSPSYVRPEDMGTVAPDALPVVRVLVTGPHPDCPSVELLFLEVIEQGAILNVDLCPSGHMVESGIVWHFNRAFPTKLESKRFFYRFPGHECLGPGLVYGWEELFDKGGTLCVGDGA